jgi:RAB protein geranylgeranyltransferase component A
MQQFDFCILGTGITCAILAGSLSKDGASVLILDKNEYYAYSKPVRQSGHLIAECQSVLKSNGSLVKLLIQSGGTSLHLFLVGKYLEFKALDTLQVDGNTIPQGKEDVFADDRISLRDKRILMKFLGMVAKHISNDTVIDLENEPSLFPGSKMYFLTQTLLESISRTSMSLYQWFLMGCWYQYRINIICRQSME